MTGFQITDDTLRELAKKLDSAACEAEALAKVLANIHADTGRSDSDEMGRFPPLDAADLLAALVGDMTSDFAALQRTGEVYRDAEGRNSEAFKGWQ